MDAAAPADRPRRFTRLLRAAAAASAVVVVFVSLVALGLWQVHRLRWKTDLIARVDRRIAAAAEPVPPRSDWARIDAAHDAYRHVTASGSLLPATTFVQATTELGAGYWAMAPLRLETGDIVFVNRGFVPSADRERVASAARRDGARPATIAGLLRLSEPKGGFLRSNDPAQARWYSRDTAAMGQADGIGPVAPFFIDAEANPGADPTTVPVAGLTVVSFPNHHLLYAITWFAMAALLAGATIYVLFTAA